jgi:N-acetylglucosaminyldiphosphoundecaprenol N-acetyl-beta-D-mannosaminyltransferase
MGKIEIFGIKFDNLTMEEAVEKINGFVVLPYSEFAVRAQKDEEFRNILNKADFCLCESRGLYLMARLMGKRLKQEISGVELIYNICKKSEFRISNFESNSNFKNSKIDLKFKIKNLKLFLFGAKQNIIGKTKENLIAKYPNLKIVGAEHGYQDLDKVIEKINLAEPEILLVGLGSPKQEKFIFENLSKMPSVKLAIGVGGAFDFVSGRVRRAPEILQKTGLEWLWRLILEPQRAKRVIRGVGGLIWLTFKNMLSLKS